MLFYLRWLQNPSLGGKPKVCKYTLTRLQAPEFPILENLTHQQTKSEAQGSILFLPLPKNIFKANQYLENRTLVF